MKKLFIILTALMLALSPMADAKRKSCYTSTSTVVVTSSWTRCDGTLINVNATSCAPIKHASITVVDSKNHRIIKKRYHKECSPLIKTVPVDLRCGKYYIIVKVNKQVYKKEIVVQ